MSAEDEEKDQKDPFAYSWYLPMTGGKSPGGEQPQTLSNEPVPEPEGEGSEGMVESAQTVAEPETKETAARSRPTGASGFHLSVSSSGLRTAGLSVWSIISGVGMIALLLDQNTLPVTQFLALGGVWAAVSALIWFLPSKLTK